MFVEIYAMLSGISEDMPEKQIGRDKWNGRGTYLARGYSMTRYDYMSSVCDLRAGVTKKCR
jgi:hypothetical protein